MIGTKLKVRAGFTIIELTIVLVIVALLASIAIPYFTTLQLKTKQAERLIMLRGIEKTVLQYISQKEALVTVCGACTCVTAPDDPNAALDGNKRPFDPNLGDWQALGFLPETWVYYRYRVVGSWCPTTGTGTLTFMATGDLDADGVLNYYYRYYNLLNGDWQFTGDSEVPPNTW